ncbi:MAG: hypothetical protein IJD82_02505 [Clostridia bacterium]|nr:hypothetical protein [Clostridia bacterium]
MKKFLTCIIILAAALTALSGCAEKEDELNIYSEASYDNVSKFVPSTEPDEETSTEHTESTENTSEESVVENAPLSGEFVVKDKKYTFEGNDLVLVSVENQTNKNYSVTITGTYLDKDGKTLKTETQTFDQYYAGFSQYFLFEPGMQFDKFTYTFEAKEYSGTIYLKGIGVKYNGIHESLHYIEEEISNGNMTKYPTVVGGFSIEHTGNKEVNVWVKWLLITEKGEILFAYDKKCKFYPGDRYDQGETHFMLHQTTDENWECPEEWKKMQAIPVYIAYTPDLQHLWPWQYPS